MRGSPKWHKSVNKDAVAWQQLLFSIGDDAAAYFANNEIQLATVDSLVQDVHFSLSYMSWQELGWKSIAVNLSESPPWAGFHAMRWFHWGCRALPKLRMSSTCTGGCLISPANSVLAIVGGDTVSSPVVFVSVTVIGCAGDRKRGMLRRSAAKPGDKIAVTNALGAAAGRT